jgi:glucosyl-3-phosphoglycerate synthase
MREITRNFGMVTTFRILVDQDRRQLADRMKRHAGTNNPVLIVPLLASEYSLPENLPVFENMLANLSQAQYLDRIIFGLDQASESQMALLQDLIHKHHIRRAVIQWNDGPVYSKIYRMLNDAGMVSQEPGKGKNIFLGIGIALALNAKVVGILDADIRSFDCIQLDRLFYPVVVCNYDFSKACYTRISNNRLYGRVKRLLVDPLLLSLKTKFIESKDKKMLGMIDFLLQFDYQLSGEVAFRADLLKKMRFSANWGAEIFTLIEIYRKASSAAQVNFSSEPFDHKHQPVSEDDLSKGLTRMAVDIVTTLMSALVMGEGLDLSEAFFRDLLIIYTGVTDKLTKMYSDESQFNNLEYDWDYEEHLARDVFSRCILHGGEILTARPATTEQLLRLATTYPQFKPYLDTGLTEAILSVESEVKEKVFETPHTAPWERVFYKIPNIQDILREAVGTA